MEEALKKAATALGNDSMLKEMNAIADQRNIYKIIQEAFNIIVRSEGNTSFADVVSKIKKTLDRSGHKGITDKSILHALYEHTPAKRMKDQLQTHRVELNKQGKAINDLISVVSGGRLASVKKLKKSKEGK
jgi:hypothetical protein